MSLMARKPTMYSSIHLSIYPSVLFPRPPLSNPELYKCSTTEVQPQLIQRLFIGLVLGEMFAMIHTGTHSMDPFWHRCYVLLKWELKRDTIIFMRVFACFCLMSFKSSFKPVSWETLCSWPSQAQITPSFTPWILSLWVKRKAVRELFSTCRYRGLDPSFPRKEASTLSENQNGLTAWEVSEILLFL